MADVFISHVAEDGQIAKSLSDAIKEAGFTTWLYEFDTVAGVSYLIQVVTAIDQAKAFLLLISRNSLGSHQVSTEVVRAHESQKAFVPILIDVSHAEFQKRQPEWRAAIGASTSLKLDGPDLSLVLPRIIAGLKALLTQPLAEGTTSEPFTTRPTTNTNNDISNHIFQIGKHQLDLEELLILIEMRGKPDVYWTSNLIEKMIEENRQVFFQKAKNLDIAIIRLIKKGYLKKNGQDEIVIHDKALDFYRKVPNNKLLIDMIRMEFK
jgi:hypothetical protein